MDYKNYYENNITAIDRIDNRLSKIINIVKGAAPESVLDIGCGKGTLLEALSKEVNSKLYGVDVYETKSKPKDWSYKSADITKALPYQDNKFDLVVLGEVIEHLPDPDFVLSEINRILKSGGLLIVSTPNMVSWINRILIPFGIQPLFTETSTKMNLGRKYKIFGQGGKVQGHLKIFTHNSLREILELSQFKVISMTGSTFHFPKPIIYLDRFFSYFPSLTTDMIFTAKKQ